MWSFATHASAGLAVAGLSATYYALARKNVELERQGRSGDDGDYNNGTKDPPLDSVQPSHHLLLKNEFDALRGGKEGHGLNAVKPSSGRGTPSYSCSVLEGTGIMSRVQSTMSMKILPHHDSSHLPGPEDEAISKATSNLYAQKIEKNVGEASDLKTNSSSIERFINERTKSPIVCFRNPDFGKRTANRNRSLLPSDSQEFAHCDTQMPRFDAILQESQSGSPFGYKDSTSFIFQPVLSESKVSVCEGEQNLPQANDSVVDTLEWSPNSREQTIPENEEFCDQPRALPLHSGDETESLCSTSSESETGSILHVIQTTTKSETENIQNVGDGVDDAVQKDSIPMKVTAGEFGGGGDCHQKKEACESKAETGTKHGPQNDNSDASPEIIDSKFLLNLESSSTCVLGRVPSASWTAWPIQMYLDLTQDHPMVALSLLAAGVLLIAVLGRIFISMGDWFSFMNEVDDYSPDASMERNS